MDIISYLLGKKAGGGTPTPPVLQEKSITITENTTTEVLPDTGYNGLSKVNITTDVSGGTIEAEEKDVNFYDYDGTRVYSYTKNEFLQLEEMPENPTHDGLTSQGWNWTLTEAKEYVTDYDLLNVGQMYIPTDGSTRIYVSLQKGRQSPYVGFAIDGEATIDWGDGSTPDTVVGTSTSTIINTQHIYDEPGDYVISISSESKLYLSGTSAGPHILKKQPNIGTESQPYALSIKKVELGNVNIGQYAFYICYQMESITMSTSVTTNGNYALSACMALKSITLPTSITSIPNYFLTSTYNLITIVLPSSITSYGSECFQACSPLKNITLPSGATYLGGFLSSLALLTKLKIPKTVTSLTGFSGCYAMVYYDFSKHTSIPSLSGSFSSIPSDCKIIVPDNLYDSWIVASRWSTYASYIIKKSDWDNL